eukprot:scaffold1435_cov162-Ochromonas_danica.AAC.3
MGTTSDFQHGVVPYCINDIFTKRSEIVKSGAQVSIDLSYLEIYMEECFDLLSKDGERKKLELRETQSGETFLEGLAAWPVLNLAEVAHFLSEAAKVRATGRTAMNSVSSRSHAICTLTIRIFQDETTLVSKLNLVDLAGSERAKKTQATGDVLQEGISINKGLLALGNVVAALSTKAKNENKNSGHVHVPYRESRLTRLLKDSLGGNGMTALLACVSPSSSNYEETLNTLRFASRASCIVNKAEVNHDVANDAGLLLRENNRLRDQLLILQDKYDKLVNKGFESNANVRKRQPSTESLECGLTEDMVIYLLTSLKLTSALKSFFMQCLNEDLLVDDSLILSVQNELQDIRNSLGYEFKGKLAIHENAVSESLFIELSIDGIDIDEENIPPIMTAIEELNNLESHMKTLLRKVSKTDDNKSTRSSQENESLEEGLHDMSAISKDDDDDLNASYNSIDLSVVLNGCETSFAEQEEPTVEELERIGAAPKDIAAKEEKIFSIVAITEQYKATIKELNEEIAILEKEREQLVAQNDNETARRKDASGGGGSAGISHDTLKFKQELKQKTKLLEEKVKVLRAKEIEFNKICRAKEKLVKELEATKSKVLEYKRKKVDMMKKMREETVAHQVESKQLKFNELQSKRHLAKAEISLQRIEQKLTNQEKCWKLKLEAKENECNRLKQLLKRQEDNRAMKEKTRLRTVNSFTTANSSNGTSCSNIITVASSKQLQQVFRDEMRNQQDMAKVHGELSYELDARRSLQQEKFDKKAKLKTLRPGSHSYRSLEENISALEKEINAKNMKVGRLQLMLQDQQELQANAQGTAMNRLPFLSKDGCTGITDLQSCLHKLWVVHFDQLKENNKLTMKLEDLQQSVRNLTPPEKDETIQAGDGEDVPTRDEMDESFYPSENDSNDDDDDDDYSAGDHAGRNKQRRKRRPDSSSDQSKTSKRSRNSIESELTTSQLSDDSEQSELSAANKAANKKPKKIPAKKSYSEEELAAIKSSQWWSMTIKDLKDQLKQRSLLVSGLKNDLVFRLLKYEEDSPSLVMAKEILEETDQPQLKIKNAVSLEKENDENLEIDPNVQSRIAFSPLSPTKKTSSEFGRQLLSPLRALASEFSSSGVDSKVVNTNKAWVNISNEADQPVLSKDEELHAFNSRFLSKKF